jgi:plastocyanin
MITNYFLLAGLGSLFVCSTTALSKEVIISQKGKVFSQSEVTLSKGDTITFKNDDDTSHNVFSSSEGTKFNLGIQKQGVTSSHKFEATGEGEIRCAIHPKMKMKVKIIN